MGMDHTLNRYPESEGGYPLASTDGVTKKLSTVKITHFDVPEANKCTWLHVF